MVQKQNSLYKKLKPLVINKESWDVLEEYLAGEKARLVTNLINCDEQDLKFIQGQVKLIDQLLNIPANLKAEEKHR